MRKKIHFILVFLSSILIISCKTATDKVTKIEDIKLDVKIQEEEISLNDEFSDFEIIPLENREECLLSNVRKMIVTDNYMYFWDEGPSSQVLSFNLDGKFKTAIGKKGHAKGEYLSIQDIATTEKGDTIVMVNIPDICLYNKEGKYLFSLPLKNEKGIESILLTDNNIYLGFFHRQENSIIKVFSKDAKKAKDIIETPCDPIRKTLGVDNITLVQQDNDIIICLDAFDSSFYVCSKKNPQDIKRYSFRLKDMLTEDVSRKPEDDDNGIFRITSYQIYNGIVRGTVTNNIDYYDFKFNLSGTVVEFTHHKEFDFSFACNHSGFFYYLLPADALMDYMDKKKTYLNPIRELLDENLSKMEGKILNTDNFYIIKMRAKR